MHEGFVPVKLPVREDEVTVVFVPVAVVVRSPAILAIPSHAVVNCAVMLWLDKGREY